MIINHNISALNAHRQLGVNNNAVAKSLEKLSSGMRINRAGDDAAGLAISEKMRGQIRGLEMAQKNALDGISLIQTAEGALQETHAILQRMRELAVQSANDTNMDKVDREAMQKELEALKAEINDIAGRTEFNTQSLIDGSFQNKVFHIGANQGQNISVSIAAMDAEGIGLNAEFEGEIAAYYVKSVTLTEDDVAAGGEFTGFEAGTTINVAYKIDGDTGEATTEVAGVEVNGAVYTLDSFENGSLKDTGTTVVAATQVITFEGVNIGTREHADASIKIIDDAINEVSSQRSYLGAIQNRLEHTINNLGASQENLTAAESRIRDVDHTEAA